LSRIIRKNPPDKLFKSQAGELVYKYGFWRTLGRQWELAALSVPFLLFVIVNNYFPIWGWSYAFFEAGKDMFPNFQAFRGLDFFSDIFSKEMFWKAFRNTLGVSVLNLVLGYVTSISLAVILNEVRVKWFKRTVQTISYLPHFVSWVVAATLINITLSPESGIVNQLLTGLGILREPKNFILDASPGFWLLMAITNVWKSIGWSAIIYIAAMTGIDPELYEAANMDGASRIRRIFAITLPGIFPMIKLLMILSIGNLFRTNFEQLLLMQRPFTLDFSEVVDTYIFKLVWNNPDRIKVNIPMGTAAGIANSLISFALVLSANRLSRFMDGESMF
jgi:putative aldouronate transport system permease protein